MGNSLAQGIHNGVGNLTSVGPWFHSGSEWESKNVITLGGLVSGLSEAS